MENPFKSQNLNNTEYIHILKLKLSGLNIHKYISMALSMCFRVRYQRCLLKCLYILFQLSYSLPSQGGMPGTMSGYYVLVYFLKGKDDAKMP